MVDSVESGLPPEGSAIMAFKLTRYSLTLSFKSDEIKALRGTFEHTVTSIRRGNGLFKYVQAQLPPLV